MSPALLRNVLAAAWRDARRVRLWLPLYVLSLVVGLAQAWPLFDNRALHNPYLSDLAFGGPDAWLAAAASNPAGASVVGGLYIVITFILIMLFGGAYNLVSSALLSQWSGGGRYLSGGLRYFLTFAVLGVVLLILAALSLAGSAGTLVAGAGAAAAIIAWALIQLINTIGEYARALAVARSRRNPIAVLAMGAAFIASHAPGVLVLAIIGICTQGALWLALAVTSSLTASWPLPVSFVIQQVLIFALIWSKVFRLSMAWHLVHLAGPTPATSAPVNPAPAAVSAN